ncbi:unnamed protein product [Staurois parvus]|uniref:Uncharacterized protein n=1 Tax=Staurois parvus TaxID=386267 RepID=A0ABN9CDC5_9NEOB|nr:unnamed protein product [Staurois parvus]
MSCQSAPDHVLAIPEPRYVTITYLPEGPGSVGGPMKCPRYLFHRLF